MWPGSFQLHPCWSRVTSAILRYRYMWDWMARGRSTNQWSCRESIVRGNYTSATLESSTHCWMTSLFTKLLVEQPYLTSCHLLIVTHNTRSCVALRCRFLSLWMLCQVWDKVFYTPEWCWWKFLHLPCKFCIVEFNLSMVSQILTVIGISLAKLIA